MTDDRTPEARPRARGAPWGAHKSNKLSIPPGRPRAAAGNHVVWRSRRVVINTFKKLMILMFIPVYAIATCNPPASAQGKTQDTLSVCSAH